MIHTHRKGLKILLALSISSLLACEISVAAPEYTPVTHHADLIPELGSQGKRDFRPPSYEGQNSALGWSKEVFQSQPGLKERVQFWFDIYTRWTSNQGLLHDSKYLHLKYDEVDFSEIDQNESLSGVQKRRARRKLVDRKKKEIVSQLRRLKKVKSPESLSADDRKLYDLFESIDEPNKFIRASKKGRLRFQLGQRDAILKGIYSSGRYIEQMEEIFEQEGLPRELVRMVFVESSFNLNARSKVGASGVWQFMRRTGKEYMQIGPTVDERNEPLEATRSAAKKLRKNYEMLGNWPLAVTGYNHGPYGVRRIVKKYGTSDIGVLTQEKNSRFGFASASFFASFLAVIEVEKKAKEIFKEVYWMPRLESARVSLNQNTPVSELVKWFGGDESLAKKFNPHIRDHVWKHKWSVSRKSFVQVPLKKQKEIQQILAKTRFKNPSQGSGSYRIGRGDTLSEIAEKFSVSLSQLREVNGITNPRSLRVGQKIHIPPSHRPE